MVYSLSLGGAQTFFGHGQGGVPRARALPEERGGQPGGVREAFAARPAAVLQVLQDAVA